MKYIKRGVFALIYSFVCIKNNNSMNAIALKYNTLNNILFHSTTHRGYFFFKMNFISFTTIEKQVLHLMLISFVGTDVSARGLLMWEEAGNHRRYVSKGELKIMFSE